MDVLPEAPEREKPTRRAAKSFLEWVLIIAGALLVAFVLKTYLVQAFYIPSSSMEPELQISDRVLVNKLSYRLHDVNRGDIVVFDRPDCDGGDPEIRDLIKRVVALGGERVEGRSGRVYIDGKPLREPYLAAGVETAPFRAYEVPAGHVFVMGDNRDNSKDSRSLCGGQATPIDEDDIVGRAFLSVWPVSSLGLL